MESPVRESCFARVLCAWELVTEVWAALEFKRFVTERGL
jgi:hypothetical protein